MDIANSYLSPFSVSLDFSILFSSNWLHSLKVQNFTRCAFERDESRDFCNIRTFENVCSNLSVCISIFDEISLVLNNMQELKLQEKSSYNIKSTTICNRVADNYVANWIQ